MSSSRSILGQVMTGGGLSIVQDPWLTEIMARDVYRVIGTVEDADEAQAQQAVRQIAGRPGFAYARVPTDDVRTVRLLEDCGFHLVDTGVTLETAQPPVSNAESERARPARSEDRAAVEGIARRSFAYSRFHLDPAIPKPLADEIKARWAGNFFLGQRGDHMVVAEQGGALVGFAQLLRASGEVLVIDLIAVEQRHRGQGLAREMIRFACSAFGPVHMVRAGTQIANTRSLRMYERMGFRIASSGYVFHHHGTIG